MSKRLSYTPPQSTLANIHQLAAVLTHSVSPSRLQYIASSIPTISIVTGDSDFAVNWKDSRYLAEMMSGRRLEVWEGVGHMIHVQEVERFNELVERCVREGGEKVARERV
jgi:pimeloyl-ACP methyl ester carboxylesterase